MREGVEREEGREGSKNKTMSIPFIPACMV